MRSKATPAPVYNNYTINVHNKQMVTTEHTSRSVQPSTFCCGQKSDLKETKQATSALCDITKRCYPELAPKVYHFAPAPFRTVQQVSEQKVDPSINSGDSKISNQMFPKIENQSVDLTKIRAVVPLCIL